MQTKKLEEKKRIWKNLARIQQYEQITKSLEDQNISYK